ncbi:probable prolyl 4-hydroxylase 10 [Tanacetum coccineum]
MSMSSTLTANDDGVSLSSFNFSPSSSLDDSCKNDFRQIPYKYNEKSSSPLPRKIPFTKKNLYLARGHDKMIQSIEKRIADFTSLPVENGEGIQIIHYEVGQKFDNHIDYFTDKSRIKKWGQRMVTVLMYLSDVEKGGQTVFPSAKRNISVLPGWNELSKSSKKGLSVTPKIGDDLLF